MTSGTEQFERDRQVLGGLELDVRILARGLYDGRDLTVVTARDLAHAVDARSARQAHRVRRGCQPAWTGSIPR
jgi:hypothetical protein